MIVFPKVTIVVTAYNIEKYIERCLKSIEGQTYKNVEVYVVDDGSTDATSKLAKSYCDGIDYFNYIWQENAGVSVARNNGIDRASGEYIVFVDGDDYLDEIAVQEYVSNIDDDADVLCSCCHAFTETTSYDDHFFDQTYHMDNVEKKERLFMQLLNGNYGKPDGKGSTAIGVPWGKLYRRSFLDQYEIRFDPELRRMQDNMFNMYVFYHARKVIYYDEAFYNYRLEHIQAKTTKYNPTIWLKVLKAREQFFQLYPEMNKGLIHTGFLYEKYVAMAASSSYAATELKYNDAVKEIKRIRMSPLFDEVFRGKHSDGIPAKFKVIKVLINLRLYPAVIAGLRMH